MGTWTISKEFHFSASHQLDGLPEGHQCARLHGHNYILVVKLEANSLIDPGFVLDYGELTFAKKLVDNLDHRHLNDLFDFNPTSEKIIQHLHGSFKERVWSALESHDENGADVKLHVGLSETPKTWAWYTE